MLPHDNHQRQPDKTETKVTEKITAAVFVLENLDMDFMLTELHENVPYRICLHPLASTLTPPPHSEGAGQREDCVEFTVSPLDMQDIVIAMTMVGGAICVMLVIICLLVAYITENIMSPTTQHSHSTYHTHSHH
ncbi:fibronectin type III domain-containing protein 10-like isoform X2 [Coregonus clupeaformis]|uniref:fibronectin type III domain-containing protein 10-like isoform X2 n=1 Tax=Coregonus clupeaformis TaxID=59861 RepID=UPI001BE117EF|nr:fibronectin type III domain-containing protein 10-like isoform X2 [Coregonus clupeaformis]